MPLSLQDLQDIATVCEAGSFRKAAEKLGITQPTLSSRVDLMEGRLGATLFERARGRSRPTQLALSIASQAKGLLTQVKGLVEQAQRMSQGVQGLVRMGAAPIPLFSLVEEMIERVNGEIADLTLVVRSGNIGKLLDLLERNEIDFAVGAGDSELMLPQFESEVLIRDDLVAVVRRGHPLAGRSVAPLREVFRHPVAVPVLDPKYRKVGRDAVGVELDSIPGTVFCSNAWVLNSLVDTGRYATICPAYCFAQEISKGDYSKICLEESLIHEVWLYTNRRSLPLPAVDAVIGIVRGVAAKIKRETERRAG